MSNAFASETFWGAVHELMFFFFCLLFFCAFFFPRGFGDVKSYSSFVVKGGFVDGWGFEDLRI